MPVYHDLAAPDALAADVERWSERLVMRWVVDQYRLHRVGKTHSPRRMSRPSSSEASAG
jgi:hypothetical protein